MDKKVMNNTIKKVAEIFGYYPDLTSYENGKSVAGIYISRLGEFVRRGFNNNVYQIAEINGIKIFVSADLSADERESYKKQIELKYKTKTQKEKVMKIIKTIKITFKAKDKDKKQAKVEWKNIKEIVEDGDKLFVELNDTNVLPGSSKVELKVWYDLKDISTYTVSAKLVEVKEVK